MVTISWDRKRSSDGGIHARMDYNNVLWKTKKPARTIQKKQAWYADF
jgi:hypothetical protein